MWFPVSFMETVAEAYRLLLHNVESVDPTMIEWVKHEIDDILGVGPTAIVVVLGALMLAFPSGLLVMARRRVRKMRGERS